MVDRTPDVFGVDEVHDVVHAGVLRKYDTVPSTLLRTAMINGLPGYVSIDRGDVLQTTALDVRDGRIAAIYIVRNPDKLRHLATDLAREVYRTISREGDPCRQAVAAP